MEVKVRPNHAPIILCMCSAGIKAAHELLLAVGLPNLPLCYHRSVVERSTKACASKYVLLVCNLLLCSFVLCTHSSGEYTEYVISYIRMLLFFPLLCADHQ